MAYYPAYRLPNSSNCDDFMPQLQKLSKNELEDLMNNEDKIIELVSNQEKVKKINLDIHSIQISNRKIAEENLQKESVHESLRSELKTKHETIKQLQEMFQVNLVKLESLKKSHNLEEMLNVLQANCAMSEEKAEELANSFYKGEIDVSQFITEFRKHKTEAHLRRIKSDRMRDLVIEQTRSSLASSHVSPNQSYMAMPENQQPPRPSYPGMHGAPYHPPYPNQHQSYGPSNPYKWN